MTEPERDREIEKALRRIPVPEHREGFWNDLDAEVTPMPHRGRGRFLAIAAALLVVVSVASALAVRDREEGAVVADRLPTSTSTFTGAGGADSGNQTADGAVRGWLDALGRGDIDYALSLTGPKTQRYIESLGGTLRGYLTESQEGYGAWAASRDRTTTEVDLPISSQQITIVVVSGTWTGEGDTSVRTDALPVVRGENGWQVEPSAFRSDTGGRLEIEKSDTAVTATAPGNGGFFFSLDDGEVKAAAGEGSGPSRKASFSLVGLSKQTHLLVVAYVDGDTLTAVATVLKPQSAS